MPQSQNLLFEDAESTTRRPPEGCWNVGRDKIVVSVAAIEFTRTRADIPDWLLDDAGSSTGQIVLDRRLAEDFLGRKVKAPSRFWR